MIAIDLGSNTLRVLAYDCNTSQPIADFERIVKTADGLRNTGTISPEAISRIIAAIREAQAQIDFTGHSVSAVTTEALRQAANTTEVLKSIARQTGIRFEVISGEEEAALTLGAVAHRLHRLGITDEYFVLVDIGGGSTELIFQSPEGMQSRSFPVGIVIVAQQYKTLDAIQRGLATEMAPLRTFVQEVTRTHGKPDTFVATAGTPTTIAAMKLGLCYGEYNPGKINGTILQAKELPDYLQRLLTYDLQEREHMVGVGRGDLITAGILIFQEVFSILESSECIVIDDGLREGVALQGCYGTPR